MTKKLIVRLVNESKTSLDFLLLDEQGHHLSDFSETIVDECDVTVLVPGHDVFMTDVHLPALSNTQLRKALPFALESHVAEDVDDLHFAIGVVMSGALPVFVVSKAKMMDWLSQLKIFLHARTPRTTVMFPDIMALPWEAESWTVFIEGPRVLVRTGEQIGFSVLTDTLWPMLRLQLKQPSTVTPKHIVWIGALPIPAEEENFLQTLSIVSTFRPHNNILTFLADAPTKRTTINLLQGDYKKKFTIQDTLLSRSAAVLTGLIFVVLTLGMLTQYSLLLFQSHKLNQQLTSNFIALFPDKPKVNPTQMKHTLKVLLPSLDSQFLTLINTAAPLVLRAYGIKIAGLHYEHNALHLLVESNNMASLNTLHKMLIQKNVKATISNTTQSNNGIEAQILIEEPTI